MTDSVRPRLGFLGLGWIGRNRLESVIIENVAEIIAISEPCEGAIRETLKIIGRHEPKIVTFEELITLDLDGIVIATPSALHVVQTRIALLRGFSVFCQKPLGRNHDEVAELIALAKISDRLLNVDLSYRHLRGLGEIRKVVQSGSLGNIVAADLIFHNAYGPDKPWFYNASLSGGGCLLDLGVHLVDAAQWIYGQPIAQVRSYISRAGKHLLHPSDDVEDYATAQLLFNSGAVGNLACSWRLHAGQEAAIKVAFYGTEGGIRLSNINGSFYNFKTERFSRTNREVLIEEENDWSAGAILEWIQNLNVSHSYDPKIELQMINSKVLDQMYANARG